jgi:hypothetical protein
MGEVKTKRGKDYPSPARGGNRMPRTAYVQYPIAHPSLRRSVAPA